MTSQKKDRNKIFDILTNLKVVKYSTMIAFMTFVICTTLGYMVAQFDPAGPGALPGSPDQPEGGDFPAVPSGPLVTQLRIRYLRAAGKPLLPFFTPAARRQDDSGGIPAHRRGYNRQCALG